MRRFDAPSWLIAGPSLSTRSFRNGWWWGRYAVSEVTYSSDYEFDSWIDGFAKGRQEMYEEERR